MPSPQDLAIARISRKECSSAEVERWLIGKGVSEDEARSTVRTLVERGWISDERFSRMLIRHLRLEGKGPRAIAQKLRQKGVRMELQTIQETASELGLPSELEAARALVERRYPESVRDRKEAGRAFQALLRRGFSTEVARAAVFRTSLQGERE